MSYTTIHQALTKPLLPRWGVIELLVEELARAAGGRRRPTDTVEHFKELYDRAYGAGEDDEHANVDPEPEALDARTPSGVTTEPPAALRIGETDRTDSAPQVDRGDGGKRGESVTEQLRRRLTADSYPPGSRLPPQRDLARELKVSRDAVQRALRVLQDEGWIASRKGSGIRVIKNIQRGVVMGPLISEAFERADVSLDVFTLTSESLVAHMRLQAERIQFGHISPRSITVRLLVPDMSLAFPYWRSGDAAQDGALKERAVGIAQRQLADLSAVFRSMLVPFVRFTVRHVPLVPSFKLYLINEVAALQGFYEVVERVVDLDGEWVQALDVLGLGAPLTHHVKDGDPHSPGSMFVESARGWFESVWQRLADQEGDV
ncbi:GntR family transcriptional regulator [Streptomyces sp. NPDC008159]|uniref:GntR family transcriptional regulator n=1 Tax=Streptomyces sp. NPDC008159 TaxID=3364817 RepID=UPI0036EF87F1